MLLLRVFRVATRAWVMKTCVGAFQAVILEKKLERQLSIFQNTQVPQLLCWKHYQTRSVRRWMNRTSLSQGLIWSSCFNRWVFGKVGWRVPSGCGKATHKVISQILAITEIASQRVPKGRLMQGGLPLSKGLVAIWISVCRHLPPMLVVSFRLTCGNAAMARWSRLPH